jgi:hypothetical protein
LTSNTVSIPLRRCAGIGERAETSALRRRRADRRSSQKAYKIRTFRIARGGSLIARVLHSRLQKLGNVEKAI